MPERIEVIVHLNGNSQGVATGSIAADIWQRFMPVEPPASVEQVSSGGACVADDDLSVTVYP